MRRVRLTFVSEFDWQTEELTPEHMDQIVEMFLDNPEGWVAPVDDEDEIIISVDDITEESA